MVKHEIVRRVEGLFALADQIEARIQKARVQVDKLTPSLLARAWTHSLPARSGCALLLGKMDSFAPAHSARSGPSASPNSFRCFPNTSSLFVRSQRTQIRGQPVPQDATDEPAERLLERIRQGGRQ